MSQNPNTPNHQPVTPAELSAEERAVFTIEKVDAWRTRQMGVLAGLRENAGGILDTQYIDDFHSSVDSTLEDFLQEQGIDQSSPNYAELKQLFYEARIGNDQDGGISDDAWENSPKVRGVDRNDEKSQRQVFEDRIAARLAVNQNVDIDTLHEEALIENERFDVRLDVKEAREAWATVNAKRQGRVLGKGENHERLRDDYHKKVQKLGILELEGQIVDEDDDTTKNAKVIEYLFREQAKLRELTTEKLKSTKISKFVEWVNKGGKLKRLGKTLILSVLTTPGFAMWARKDKSRGMQNAEAALGPDGANIDHAEIDTADTAARLSSVAKIYNDSFETDTKYEQKKRRKAVYWGAGALGATALAGAGGALIVDAIGNNIADVSGDVTGKVKGIFDGSSRPGAIGNEVSGEDLDVDNDGEPDAYDKDRDGDGTINTEDTAPNDPDKWLPEYDSRSPLSIEDIEISEQARMVENGEGWYQTFQELGIPQDRWATTLEVAGPELQNQDWAYFDESANEWRISQPGRLPDKALLIIAESADQAGYSLAA